MTYLVQLSDLIWSCSIHPCSAEVYALLQAIGSCNDVSPFQEQHNSCILSDTAQLHPITKKSKRKVQCRCFHDINIFQV